MVAHASIHHKLDLALRLVNTTTGKVVEEYNAKFISELTGLKAIPKQGGMYLFLNVGSEEFEIDIHVYGYESQRIQIRLSELQGIMPIREVYLLPKEAPIQESILTLRGTLSGIEELEAVSLSDTNCCIKEFDARKKVMSVLNQRNVRFQHVHYGLVNRERTEYEHFEVEKEISPHEIKCKKVLEKEFYINQPIARVIFGQISNQEEYLLRVMKDENTKYLVRYVVDGKVFYQTVDFHKENISLKAHEKKEETEHDKREV
ncbi:MAG: hypothetical protein IKY94_14490 [Lachnospiraceae bacterium]|nr:hypothetical protein [Lachnospiraceae bacterium]